MAKQPEQRYRALDDLRAELSHLLDDAPRADTVLAVRPEPRPGSGVAHGADAREVRTARPQLVLLLALSLLTLTAGVSSALSGVVTLTVGDWPFEKGEVALMLLGLLGTLFTPAVLLVRRLRRTVWDNSARVLDVVRTLRAPLQGALVAYGLAALSLRFCDEVVVHIVDAQLVGHPLGSNWAGFSLLLPAIGVVGALSMWLRRRFLAVDAGRLRTVLAGPLLMLVAVTVCVALLRVGLILRSGIPVPPAVAHHVEVGAMGGGSTAGGQAIGDTGAGSLASAAAPIERAPDEALAQAVAAGVEGLLPLSEKYPQDPAVLKALATQFASKATGHADAMAVVKRLFKVAPEERHDKTLQFLVSKASRTPGEASKLAYELMTSQMADAGADLLYHLTITSPKQVDEALTLLAKPEIQQHFSPALKVAYELRTAGSCAARVPLLSRAAQLGDERSVYVLSPLSASSKKGCGKWKNKPCRAQCPDEAADFLKAIRSINQRLEATTPK